MASTVRPSEASSSTCGPGVKGYDCMSLAQYAVFQVTGMTVPVNGSLPGPGRFIAPNGTVGLEPGDVMFFGGPSLDDYSHSAIYAGNGMLYDALEPGDVVQQHTFAAVNSDYGNVYRGAVRYVADTGIATSTTTTLPHPVFGIRTRVLGPGTVSTPTHPTNYAQKLKAFGREPAVPVVGGQGFGITSPGLHLNAGTGVIAGHAGKAGRYVFKVASGGHQDQDPAPSSAPGQAVPGHHRQADVGSGPRRRGLLDR